MNYTAKFKIKCLHNHFTKLKYYAIISLLSNFFER